MIENNGLAYYHSELTESLQKILDYLVPSEFQHYCESSTEERTNHIYNDLELVQKYMTQPYKDPRQQELF